MAPPANGIRLVLRQLLPVFLFAAVLQTISAVYLAEWDRTNGQRRSTNFEDTSDTGEHVSTSHPPPGNGTSAPIYHPPSTTLRSDNLALPAELRDLLRFYEKYPAEQPDRTSCKSATDPLRLKLEKDVNVDVRTLLYRYFVFHREEMRAFRAMNGTDLRVEGSRRIRFVLAFCADGRAGAGKYMPRELAAHRAS